MSKGEAIQTALGLGTLKRRDRKTLAISVLPDGGLELVAPRRVGLAAILAKVEKRTRWILNQRRKFCEINAVRPPLRYVSGATHRYLGRQYRLKVSKVSEARVALRGGLFHVSVADKNESHVKNALDEWYRRRAREQFERRLSAWLEWCRIRKLPAPKLKLRTMEKRWGSALRDGTIYLNPELIRASSACIDYVIAHEICHLKYPNHGREFRDLLQSLCPDCRLLKARLEQMV